MIQRTISPIEIKSNKVTTADARGLHSLDEDFPKIRKLIVVPTGRPRNLGDVEVISQSDFFETLKKL